MNKLRLFYRIAVFIIVVSLYACNQIEAFFPLLVIFYLIALLELLLVLFPYTNNKVSSGKLLLKFYNRKPFYDLAAYQKSKRQSDRGAWITFVIWAFLMFVFYQLKQTGIFNDGHLALVALFFYMCDAIYIALWCPFRILLGTKCCTTCRIYNWGHIMAFAPLLFVKFVPFMLLGILSLMILFIWEIAYLRYPERFYPESNASLHCFENCSCKKGKKERAK